ncbi:uncharacterized protein LOC143891827 [Tasmannia lanceolata]|uniref:uncharacterized protein LOC143891827 n=1 Tax=Tasmannia lanceolata TaxID=3420 RepID=UPI00406368F9
MPKGSKKRRAEKKKKENESHIHSPTHSQEGDIRSDDDLMNHDGKDSESSELPSSNSDYLIEDQIRTDSSQSGFDKTTEGSENKDVSIEFVESFKGSHGDSSSEDESSASGLEEESQSVENLSERELGKFLESNFATSQSVDPTEPIVSLSEEVAPVIEATPVENSKAFSGVFDSRAMGNLSERELGKVVDSNSATSQSVDATDRIVSLSEEVITVVEAAPVENSRVSGVVDSSVKENEELITMPLSSGTDPSEKAIDSGECHKESDEPESSEKEVVLARRPVQPTSWGSCCGLFDLLRGSHG